MDCAGFIEDDWGCDCNNDDDDGCGKGFEGRRGDCCKLSYFTLAWTEPLLNSCFFPLCCVAFWVVGDLGYFGGLPVILSRTLEIVLVIFLMLPRDWRFDWFTVVFIVADDDFEVTTDLGRRWSRSLFLAKDGSTSLPSSRIPDARNGLIADAFAADAAPFEGGLLKNYDGIATANQIGPAFKLY